MKKVTIILPTLLVMLLSSATYAAMADPSFSALDNNQLGNRIYTIRNNNASSNVYWNSDSNVLTINGQQMTLRNGSVPIFFGNSGYTWNRSSRSFTKIDMNQFSNRNIDTTQTNRNIDAVRTNRNNLAPQRNLFSR